MPSFTDVRVACGVSNGTAVLVTTCRLLVRILRGRLWVDDWIALFSMCTLIIQLAVIIHNPTTQYGGVVRYYVLSNMFYAAIWSARLSILFSIIRVTGTCRKSHDLYTVAALFLLAWILLTGQIYWECEAKTSWKHLAIPQCRLSDTVAICQLITDVISDSILLLLPIRFFIIIQERHLRHRVMVIFGTCIGTTIVSAIHAAFLFETKPLAILVAAVVENSVSLIVCNVPVITTVILKLRKTEDPLSEISPSGLIPRFVKTSEVGLTAAGSVTTNLHIPKTGPMLHSQYTHCTRVEEERHSITQES